MNTSKSIVHWPEFAPDDLRLGALKHGEVHLFAVEVAASPATERALSSEERIRAARFRFETDRVRYGVAQAALRHLLGLYLDDEPASFTYARGPRGKPSLSGRRAGALQFNLSHAAELVLIAFARLNVGVDIERYDRRLSDLNGIARRCFSARELAEWTGYPDAERVPAFLRCWTRKEAFIKATGDGMWSGLSDFDVTLAPDDVRVVEVRQAAHAGRPWSLHHLEPADGYVGALAISGKPRALRFRRYSYFETS